MHGIFEKTVADVFKVGSTANHYGVEIEMECEETHNISSPLYKRGWRTHADHSLKYNGIEYVSKPTHKDEVRKEIEIFRKRLLIVEGVEIRPSIRAGVHIHVNWQRRTIAEMLRFLAVYYALEAPMTKFCGAGREGNLFCLRGTDAEGSIKILEDFVETKNTDTLYGDSFRYGALNLQSLFKFGTLEFRALATTPKLDNIIPWIDLIEALMDYTKTVTSAWEISAAISGEGGEKWAEEVFGNLYPLVEYEGLGKDVLESLRNIQYFLYLLNKEGV